MRWVRLGQLTWQYIRVVVGGGGVKGNFIYVFILLKKAQIIANVMLYASKIFEIGRASCRERV